MSGWRYYFPEDGEEETDARELKGSWADAEAAAERVAEIDWDSRDGWERGESEFKLVVIDPSGKAHPFIGKHEQTVEHWVREADVE